MSWYNTGTIAVTNGSATVNGTGTAWVGAVQAGWALPGPDGRVYEIQSVDSATQITLATNYVGSTQTGQSYAIMPTQGLEANLASSLQTLISNYQSVYNNAGQGKFGDGAVGTPGITFSSDTTTGFYAPAVNELAAAVGGVQQLLITTSKITAELPIDVSTLGPASGALSLQSAGATHATLDTNGNFGLGVVPSAWFSSRKALEVNNGAAFVGVSAGWAEVFGNSYLDASATYRYLQNGYASLYQSGNLSGTHTWFVAPSGTTGATVAFTQAMTLDNSANLLVGLTSYSSASTGCILNGTSGILIVQHGTALGSGYDFADFYYEGSGKVGSITQTGTTGVAYNTTSDQRLKTNIADAAPAAASFMQIPFRQFDWIAGGSHQDYGGIAQELQPIAPEIVTVPDDPKDMWLVDWSKLVPRMGKALQEALAKIDDLVAQIQVLASRVSSLEAA